MAIAKFPVNTPQSVGRFWIPGSETSGKTDGFCKVDASGISIEVSNPLTPGYDMVQVTNGVEVRQARDLNDLIVYGTIPFAPKELTFFDAWTTTRHSVGIPFGDSREDQPQLHRLSASWCIAGAHVESPASTFEAFRVRFTHLELWARHTGIDMRIHTEKPLGAMIDFRRPQDITAPFGEFDEKRCDAEAQHRRLIAAPHSLGRSDPHEELAHVRGPLRVDAGGVVRTGH